VRTFASPAGSKKSAVGHAYTKHRAPDKGAVGVHLGGADLLILNLHLCGNITTSGLVCPHRNER
jgi:hypothetical protein